MGFSVKQTAMWVGRFISGGTSGSIHYTDANGNLAEDNTKLFYDATNKRVGIGTNTPSVALDVKASAAGQDLIQIKNSVGTVVAKLRVTGADTGNITVADSGGTAKVVATELGLVSGGATINTAAVLEAQSTTKGFLLPRMTTTQKNAIASPTGGLMVYDTTLSKASLYTGAAWETVTSI
jgi:hypothetical protein